MTSVILNPSAVLFSLPVEASDAKASDAKVSLSTGFDVEPAIEVSAEAVKLVALDLLRDAGVVNGVVVDLIELSTTSVELGSADPDTLAILEALGDGPGDGGSAEDFTAIGLEDRTGDVVVTVVVDSLTGEIPAVGVDYDLVVDDLASAASASDASVYQIPDGLIAAYAVVDESALPDIPIFITALPATEANPGVDMPIYTTPELGIGVLFPTAAEFSFAA